MSDDRLPLAELMKKAGSGDFLLSVAKAVVQLHGERRVRLDRRRRGEPVATSS